MSRVSKSNAAIYALSGVVVVALIIAGVLLGQRDPAQPPATTDPGAVEPVDPSVNPDPDGLNPGQANPDAGVPAPPPAEEDPYRQLSGYEQLERRDQNDPLAVGETNAPVVMVVYSDYQCGYCARWSAETLPALEDYVADGKLRIEWRDANIFGENSARGAHAAYAAGLQGEYLAYHDRLFAGASPQDLSQGALESYAAELNLDMAQFTEDMASTQTADAVLRNQVESQQIGVTSTPSFIIGGIPLLGAQPLDIFINTIDAALSLSANSAQ